MPSTDCSSLSNDIAAQTVTRTRLLSGKTIAWVAGLCLVLGFALAIATNMPAYSQSADEDAQISKSLAAMLRAGRTVISSNQDRINNPNLGDKGLDSKMVLNESVKIYRESTKVDPLSLDPKTRPGKLIRLLMDSIAEVMDVHQQTLNRQGVGFKGFIPALFSRLVNEAFGRRAAGLAEMKVTAPFPLIRNARARPDPWETEVISDKLLSSGWPKDQSYAAVTQIKGKTAYRTAVPEYYGSSCLTCHGTPKGETDLTGFPKDGANEGDLGGVISITLYR
jgi:uncharacterized protein DUF3365